MNAAHLPANVADCTVVIPCHNQGHYLHECLASVVAQTTTPREIIIIDDGSTCPKTRAILASEAIIKVARVLRNETARGLPAARNQGITNAATAYILPLDADDKIAPGYIEKAVQVLMTNTNIGIVGGESLFFGTRSGKTSFPEFSKWRMTVDNCIISAAVFRKSDWTRAGGYCEEFTKGFEDWDFYLSLLESGLEYCHLNEIVYYYRRHKTNMTDRLDKTPSIKEEIFSRIYNRHTAYFKKYAHEASRFLYTERSKFRAFGKNRLIIFCRKLLRTFEDIHMSKIDGRNFLINDFTILAMISVLVIAFEIYFSVFRIDSRPAQPILNIELIREAAGDADPNDSIMIVGLKADGKRLPLAILNASRSGEMPLTLLPMGKSNESAKGSEIWLLSQSGSQMGVLPQSEGKAAGWRVNTDVWHVPALVSVGGGDVLKFSVNETEQALFFIRHPWSGSCKITAGEIGAEFDLYDANKSTILPVFLVNQKFSAAGIPNSATLNIQIPEDTVTEIGFLKSAESKWIISRITDGVGGILKKSARTGNFLPTADAQFRSYWLFAFPVGLLVFFAYSSINNQQSSRKLYYLYAGLLAATVSSFVVMIFYPCLMSSDSFDQWMQSKTGQLYDYHPLGLSILMAACQKLAFAYSDNTQAALAAWVSGAVFWFACYTLIGCLLRNVKLAIFATLAVMLYYPLWPYAATLWKDVPYTAAVIFYGAYIINVIRNPAKARGISSYCISTGLIIMMLLNRQTAWAVLLACVPVILFFMPNGVRLRQAGFMALSLMAAFVVIKLSYAWLKVGKTGNLTNVVLSYELVGTLHMAKADKDEILDLATTKKVGIENMMEAMRRYEPGRSVDPLIFGADAPFGHGRLLDSNCVLQDLPQVCLRHPVALLLHKWNIHKILWNRKPNGETTSAFQHNIYKPAVPLLRPGGETAGGVQSGTGAPNGPILYENSKIPALYVPLRNWLLHAAYTPGSIWQIPFRHIFVFIAMLASIVVAGGITRIRNKNVEFFTALLFLGCLAIASWLPYVVTLPAADWRYLLPTTFIGVIITTSTIFWLVGCDGRRRETILSKVDQSVKPQERCPR